MCVVLCPISVLFSIYASRPQASATWTSVWEGKACNRKRSLLVLYGLACCLLKMPQNWESSEKMHLGSVWGPWEWRSLCAQLSLPLLGWLRGIQSSWPCAPGQTNHIWADTENTFKRTKQTDEGAKSTSAFSATGSCFKKNSNFRLLI